MAPQKLNIDVFYEIFKYFVAIDEEGPLRLRKVCRVWRDLVESNPRFWTWITIDENVWGNDEQVERFTLLSADLPLQIIIHSMTDHIRKYQKMLNRCQSIFIYIHENNLSYPSHTDIQNAEAWVLSTIGMTSKDRLEHIYWYIEGHPTSFCPEVVYAYLVFKNKRSFASTFRSLPCLAISSLQIGHSSPFNPRHFDFGWRYRGPLPISKLWNALSQLSCLTTLSISQSFLTELEPEKFRCILLPMLQDLNLQIPTSDWDPNWSILSYFRAPALHSVSLTTSLKDMYLFKGASKLCTQLHPKRLRLEASSYMWQAWTNAAAPPLEYHLPSLKTLEIEIKWPYDRNVVDCLIKEVNSLVSGIPNLSLLHLCLADDFNYYLGLLGNIPCPLHVTCIQPPSEAKWAKMLRIGTRPERKSNNPIRLRIEKLILNVDYFLLDVWAKLHDLRVIEVDTYVILPPDEMSLTQNWASVLQQWARSLNAIDMERVILTSSSLVSAYSSTPFTNLATVRCPPLIAAGLIEHHLVPQLRELTLSRVKGALITTQGDLIQFSRIFIKEKTQKPPWLETLALEFYPSWWRDFIQLLSLYAQPLSSQEGVALRYLKLPALPSSFILHRVILALQGNQTIGREFLPLENRKNEDCCRYCKYSRWKCHKRGTDHCRRHSLQNLVTISRETKIWYVTLLRLIPVLIPQRAEEMPMFMICGRTLLCFICLAEISR